MIKLANQPDLLREIEKQLNSGKVIELKLIVKEDAEIINISTITRNKVFSKKLNR